LLRERRHGRRLRVGGFRGGFHGGHRVSVFCWRERMALSRFQCQGPRGPRARGQRRIHCYTTDA
jgi:hypothetical protein